MPLGVGLASYEGQSLKVNAWDSASSRIYADPQRRGVYIEPGNQTFSYTAMPQQSVARVYELGEYMAYCIQVKLFK